MTDLSKLLTPLHPDLRKELEAHAILKEVPQGTEILREGQYVKVIPIVLEGLIKVFSRHEEKELLLYYIKPQESCIMSFAAGMKNEPSKIFAVTEEDTTALLLPTDKVALWVRDYPEVNQLFFQQYNLRYSDLLTTIHQLLFERMDKRLLDYLVNKSLLTGRNPIKISHRQIAAELGTAREVISRIMKKLENDGKIRQEANTIEIL
ncbi:MAG: Crp/Fnr family transcriptional regulator [Saprospiraceae bacterium]|nr:Crp/Fnr family transcriptional regulator [Candidatus Opimibacter skivensis]